MRKKMIFGTFIIAVQLLMIAGFWSVVNADPPRQSERVPTIIDFRADVDSITIPAAESGTVETTLRWQIVGLTSPTDYWVQLSAQRLNEWVPLLEGEVLGGDESRQVTIQHTLDFQPPTFRLAVMDASGQVRDEWRLTIPYDYAAMADSPEISTFSVDTDTALDADALFRGTILLPVVWEVENRVPRSNLRFEQMLDERVVSVELPRRHLWIASAGEGVVRPVLPPGDEPVRLRLVVTDVVDGTVYDQEMVEIEVTGEVQPTPTLVAPTPVTAQPSPSLSPGTPNLSSQCFASSPVDVSIYEYADNQAEIIDTLPAGEERVTWVQSGDGWVQIIARPGVLGWVNVDEVTLSGYCRELVTPSPTAEFTPLPGDTGCPDLFFFQEPGAVYQFAGGPYNTSIFDVCPTSETQTTGAAFQMFENGFMVWREDLDQIFVMTYDGSLTIRQNDYTEGETLNFNETPPDGREVPARGFGKLWINDAGIRSQLGWATAAERGYTMRYQESLDGGIRYVVMTMATGGRFVAGLPASGANWWAYINQVN